MRKEKEIMGIVVCLWFLFSLYLGNEVSCRKR